MLEKFPPLAKNLHCWTNLTSGNTGRFFILTKMMVVLNIHLPENFTERDKYFTFFQNLYGRLLFFSTLFVLGTKLVQNLPTDDKEDSRTNPRCIICKPQICLFSHSFQALSKTNEPERWSCQQLFSSFLTFLTSQVPYLQKSEANLDKFLNETAGFLYKWFLDHYF